MEREWNFSFISTNVTHFMCLTRCMNRCLCLCVRNFGFWAAKGSNWLMLIRPSSGSTVSTQRRQMLSRHEVTSMLDTEPLGGEIKVIKYSIFFFFFFFFFTCLMNAEVWTPCRAKKIRDEEE